MHFYSIVCQWYKTDTFEQVQDVGAAPESRLV